MSTSEINYRRHGSRYKARRRAVDIIFEAEARDEDPVAIVDERVELARNIDNAVAPVADYTRELVRGTAERLDELDETIARYLSEDWELTRLPAVDRAILRVMAWEITYNPEVDAPISVVDGVEIATQYSTHAAAPYIHAVLDDIAQAQSADNPMNVVPDIDEEDTEESVD
ncbi:transcription antitermination factor NusB [Corynebacterium tapiri]|uniref:Transcription antitermination protein NusB n=1 Tax=Corynebacterium tapiri TaxID=1448266 RepID=A0A5C4U5D2_9CORY|nr:transcription antitermination factor NusB [Corynebacterium tapiri]TNL97777.1 transcription antitermination factor NusB [Corynebacterium tapiri]